MEQGSKGPKRSLDKGFLRGSQISQLGRKPRLKRSRRRLLVAFAGKFLVDYKSWVCDFGQQGKVFAAVRGPEFSDGLCVFEPAWAVFRSIE